jgi:hypothetical protein
MRNAVLLDDRTHDAGVITTVVTEVLANEPVRNRASISGQGGSGLFSRHQQRVRGCTRFDSHAGGGRQSRCHFGREPRSVGE